MIVDDVFPLKDGRCVVSVKTNIMIHDLIRKDGLFVCGSKNWKIRKIGTIISGCFGASTKMDTTFLISQEPGTNSWPELGDVVIYHNEVDSGISE